MISLSFTPPKITTELYFGRQQLKGNLIKELASRYGSSFVVICDQDVKKLHGDKLAEKLGARILEIPKGGKAKTREVKQQIEDELLKAGCGSETVLIGLGGGATTDLTGFIAATYLRGIPFILVPTTLLAMVDASIGGKTAVDTPFGKNLIGSFYHPKGIVSDLDTLNTLPERDLNDGYAEIYKMGLIMDSSIITDHKATLDDLALKAARGKMSVIEQDPYETKGLRRTLNYGHTIGHAYETTSNYSLSHGEAVVLGCIAESYLSHRLGYLTEPMFHEIENLLKSKFQHVKLPKICTEKAVLESMAHDKKRSGKQVRCVFIDKIGHAIPFEGQYCRPVSQDEFKIALNYIEKHYA